jgi:hypothetical protein
MIWSMVIGDRKYSADTEVLAEARSLADFDEIEEAMEAMQTE